jgi:hypothetical protein
VNATSYLLKLDHPDYESVRRDLGVFMKVSMREFCALNFTARLLDVAQFGALQPHSLAGSCRLSLPVVCYIMFSVTSLASNRCSVWKVTEPALVPHAS